MGFPSCPFFARDIEEMHQQYYGGFHGIPGRSGDEAGTTFSDMRAIRSMKRAGINEQYLKVPHKGKAEPVLRGPYYVMTWHEQGRGF
jgi:hypothetical protein